ncbi:MAG: response regulator [Bacteroidota bacterium]
MFILLVEDDPFYATMLIELLKNEGYDEIKHVDNGLECLLQVYEERVPDVIIMDQQLGMVNGVEVLQKIRAYKPDLRVIFMSGQKNVKLAVQSIKQGAREYIKKDEKAFENLLPVLKEIESEMKNKSDNTPVKKAFSKIKKFLMDND